uniref:G-protein coupled receptors family 1 profile domain-containing protein n=1 Tax=Lates calcarifer TaxID=8187 RepID=A0A4W6BUD0_LATCA
CKRSNSSTVSNTLIYTRAAICVFLNIFLGSLCVLTVCGNLLVIISIIYFKQLHTPTNYLILSLAVADLLVGVLVLPLTIEFVCKIQNIFDVTLSTASILNLCFISIDRYYAVCQPLTYRTKINADSAVVMILVTWSFSILIGITLYIVELKLEICQEMCLLEIFLLNALAPFFAFYLPLIIMLCIYLKIFLVAQRQARSIHNTNCQSTKSGATVSKMERKATKTLATVLGAFLMCWLPYFLSLMCFALSNSMFNPFIYALFYSWFRSAFRMIISGKIFRIQTLVHCKKLFMFTVM